CSRHDRPAGPARREAPIARPMPAAAGGPRFVLSGKPAIRWPTRRPFCSASTLPCGGSSCGSPRASFAAATRESNSCSARPCRAEAWARATAAPAQPAAAAMRRPERRRWRETLAASLAQATPFAGCALRPGRREDEPLLFALHREAMRDYVTQTWGWDEHWQRVHFVKAYVPANHAIIVRREPRAAHGEEP